MFRKFKNHEKKCGGTEMNRIGPTWRIFMKHVRFVLVILYLVLCCSGIAICQQLIEPSLYGKSVGAGARAFGMGGAFIAVADDATASSWNPAGLCALTRPEGSIVWRSDPHLQTDFTSYEYRSFTPNISPGVDYTYEESGLGSFFSQEGNTFDFASITYPLQMGNWALVPQFNYQRIAVSGYDPFLSPFGFTAHDFLSDGTDFGTYTEEGIGDGHYSGGLDLYAASLGISFHPKLYFGIVLNRWTGGVNGSVTISYLLTNPTGSYVEFDGGRARSYRILDEDLNGWNFNVGSLFKPFDKLHFGFVFKSPFSMDYSVNVGRAATGVFGRNVLSTTRESIEEGKIDWPSTFGVGIAVLPLDVWTLSVDYTKSKWGSADYNYQFSHRCIHACRPDFSETLTRTWPLYFNSSNAANGANRKQEDTHQLRFGTEYVAFWKVHIPLRAGYFIDRQLFADARGKTVTFNGWTAGAGLAWSHILLDFAFVHEYGDYRTQEYAISNASQTVTLTESGPEKFRSNSIYVSTIFRL